MTIPSSQIVPLVAIVMKTKALIAMRGGVDSSVAAYLTQYYDYIGTGQLQIDNSMSALVDSISRF